ncbi:CBS domain-containing protein [Baaleninema sp.]|uniref:CBS domain-containing protein n=1 Tax=Baaleninema sp. TaxID=3101197 RepID=UPI003CFE0BE0
MYAPTLEDILDRAPLTVKPDTSLLEVLAQMNTLSDEGSCDLERRPTSCALVVEKDALVGIFTERDLVRLSVEGGSIDSLSVGEVMTPSPIVLPESDYRDLFSVVSRLRQHRIRHLPVVDEASRLRGLISHDSLRRSLSPFNLLRLKTVAEVMSRNVVCISPEASVLEAVEVMTHHRTSCIVVGDADESQENPDFRGILSERDIVRVQISGRDLTACRAKDLASFPILSIRPQESLWVARQHMETYGVRRLLVTGEDGELLGILTQSSLLDSLSPVSLYEVIDSLQNKVSHLEREKLHLLQQQNQTLEAKVQRRTSQVRQQSEQLRSLTHIAAKICDSLDLDRVLTTTVEEVRRLLESDRVLVYQFDADLNGTIVAESVEAGFSAILHRQFEDTCFRSGGGEAYKEGQHTILEDIENTTDLSDCYREMLQGIGVKANLVVPLLLRGEDQNLSSSNSPTLWGLLIAHQCRSSRRWKPEEVALLDDLGVQLSIAIQQSQLYQQVKNELQERRKAETALRDFNEQLEEGIRDRTAALKQRDRYLQGLVEVQRQLLTGSLERNGYDTILAVLGQISQASRVYVFEAHMEAEGTFLVSQTAEWCAEGVESQLDNPDLQNFPLDALPGCAEPLKAGLVYSGNVAEFSEEERAVLEPQGILSIAIVPISVSAGAQLFGFIGFDRCDEARLWTPLEIGLLQSAARSIALAKEREKAEDALLASREQYRRLVESLREVIFQVDGKGCWSFLNGAWTAITGFSVAETLGQRCLSYVDERDRAIAAENFQNLRNFQASSHRCQLRFRKADGDICWLDVDAIALRDRQGQFIGVSGTLNDVTERHKAQEERDRTQERLEMALEAAEHGVWDWNLDTNEAFFSPRYYTMLGYEPNEFASHFQSWVELVHPEDLEQILPQIQVAIQKGNPYSFEFRMKAKSGDWKWIQGSGKIYNFNSQQLPRRVVGTHVDITERKLSEQKIQESLEEKELLLKEIHHRVKNNLLVVASLLELQSVYTDEEYILKILEDSQIRIQSMALIHEKLYGSTDLSHINFSDYLEALIGNLFLSYSLERDRICCHIEAQPIFLNIETANPCGLIVNELVSNVFKHAFPNPRSGDVWLILKLDKETIRLTVKDNGVGIPEEVDIFQTESLGMQLVTMLAKQLRAEVSIDRSEGTAFHIEFSELQYKRRM